MSTTPTPTPDTPVVTPADTPQNTDQEFLDQLVTPVEPVEFLRIDDRTVYKTTEAAQQGWQALKAHNQKLESENSSLRQSLVQSGSDDLMPALATSVNDTKSPAFQNALQKIIKKEAQGLIQDSLRSLAPTIGYANFNRAVEIASNSPNGDPNIANFVRSPAFAEMSKTHPTLISAIAEARYNSSYVEKQLPEMLILAYTVAQAKSSTPATPTTPSSTSPALPIGSKGTVGTDTKDINWGSVDWSQQSG